MTTTLKVYNAALFAVGQRKLASTTEAVESQRVITEVYADVVNYCLEQGQWNFATRAVKIDADPGITIEFGYSNAFGKPVDWRQTCEISAAANFMPPLLDYRDEVDYWVADCDPLYVAYVSNDVLWGLNLSAWPETFARYVELELACVIHPRLKNETGFPELEKRRLKALRDAKNKDAKNEGPKQVIAGRLIRARRGGSSITGSDRGL